MPISVALPFGARRQTGLCKFRRLCSLQARFYCTTVELLFNVWRKGELLDRQDGIGTLRTISWQEFEELVGEVFKRKGYAVTENGGGGADW